jgi:hypothetical protein
MKSWKLMMLCSAVSLTACQKADTQWSDLQGVPDGFKDGQDDVRSDTDVRAIAHDEATQVATALDAKLVAVEADPVYAASAASGITAEQVAAWDAQAAKSETDPAFTASAASTISTTDVTNWDNAFSWGNHAAAGYLKAEADPKVGALASGSVPMWNGTQLADSAIRQVNGNVGIGTTGTPSALLTVSTLAKFGAQVGTGTNKSCSIGGTNWTNTPPSSSACTSYCTTLGFTGGTVVPMATTTPPKHCGGASCDYISDFETCTTASMQNNNNSNSCASAFVCSCTNPGTEISGNMRVKNGNLGIGVDAPNSPLQVNGYLQLGTTASTPPATDCDDAAERGRMLLEPATGKLWVCVNSGWLSK